MKRWLTVNVLVAAVLFVLFVAWVQCRVACG